jgi:hypothetical protein
VRLLLGLAVLLVAVPAARAGDYVVHSCKEEAGTPVYATSGWHAIGSVNAETVGDGCFRGGSLFARLPGGTYVSGTLVGWQFDAPAGTEIAGYRISRSVTVGKPSAGGAAPAYYLTWPTLSPGDIREQCVQPACSALGRRDKAVPENIILSPGGMAGVRSLFLVAGCGGPAGQQCLAADSPAGTDTARVDIHATQITLRDMAAPAIAVLSGPLADAGRKQTGTTSISAHATDAGGGVAAFSLDIDGRQVGAAAAPGCPAAPFTAPTPCPTDSSQTLELDTTTLGYGRHTARVVVHDAGGNATVSAAIGFRVDNRRIAAYGALLRYDYDAGRRGTRFTRLSARRVPRGAAITLRCSGGGCPFKRKRVVRSARRSTYSVVSALKHRLLRPHARLEVRVTAGDRSVQRRSFEIRRGKLPRRSGRCRAGDAGSNYHACS